MIDKNFCMSSFLAFRYIERKDIDFFEGMRHDLIPLIPEEDRVLIDNASEIDSYLQNEFAKLKSENLGILLSGGMDSANLASYMEGADAYTFRFENGFQTEELNRAEYYAKRYGLRLHYVDIKWSETERCLSLLMERKCSPVHSIEPQIYMAAQQAKKDGITMMVTGESADLLFGGMDQLLACDWTLEAFQRRYLFTNPLDVLADPVDMSYLFERFRQGDKIDFISFMDAVYSIESPSSYWNAFACADMPYIDPYTKLKMKSPLNLERVRNGEPKYLIRELFQMRYPELPVPDKVPMPRPVDFYFKDWKGPTRKEFLSALDMNEFTGNQKWQIYCLERFLEQFDPQS